MGIDIVQFQRLARLSQSIEVPTSALMLGRQSLLYRGKGDRFFNRALAEAGHADVKISDVLQDDGYAEAALEQLGYGLVKSLDYSNFEGADFIHDLNQPIGPELEGRFDFIFDGGTLEHVFDVPTALKNVFRMLSPNGIFVSANGMNGWWGHGLYQFGAELVWSFWSRTAGCEVMTCDAVPSLPKFGSVPLIDPATLGHRLFGLGRKLPTSRVYLYYEIRKTPGAKLNGTTMQSDYAARWGRAGQANMESAEQ